MVNKGDIYLIQRRDGATSTVLILSSPQCIRESGLAVAIPLSRRDHYPAQTHIYLPRTSKKPLVGIVEKIRNIDAKHLRKRLGTAAPQDMAAIEAALCKLLEL